MRSAARLKMGCCPLPESEGNKLHALLSFGGPASVIDPCVGQGQHGGHVGLLCTAGLLNGVFGYGEIRHIARWRSVKHVTTFVEEDGDA